MFIVNINDCMIIKNINIQFSNSDLSVQFADVSSYLMKSDDIVCKKTDDSESVADQDSVVSSIVVLTFFLIQSFSAISTSQTC